MRKQTRRNKAVSCGLKMPPLTHQPSNSDSFDIMSSKAAEWLCSQPEVRQYVFDAAKETGAIEFDSSTRTWHGTDWNG